MASSWQVDYALAAGVTSPVRCRYPPFNPEDCSCDDQHVSFCHHWHFWTYTNFWFSYYDAPFRGSKHHGNLKKDRRPTCCTVDTFEFITRSGIVDLGMVCQNQPSDSPRIWLKLAFVAQRTGGVFVERSFGTCHWRSACSASFLEFSKPFGCVAPRLSSTAGSCFMKITSLSSSINSTAAALSLACGHPQLSLSCATTRTISKLAVRQRLCNFQPARCFVQVHHHLQAGVDIWMKDFWRLKDWIAEVTWSCMTTWPLEKTRLELRSTGGAGIRSDFWEAMERCQSIWSRND